jgi:hypothetical protein
MNKIGILKSKIENSLTKSYGKDTFKSTMKNFKEKVLNKKYLVEAFYIYNQLSTPKGMDMDIASDYILESFNELQNIIEKNQKDIQELSDWVDTLLGEANDEYANIDKVLYNKGMKNLETVLESKKEIKKLITSPKIQKQVFESTNIPLSSMLKIATNTFNKEYGNISESEKMELKSLFSLNKKEIETEMTSLRESVIEKLENTTNSEDMEISDKVKQTIQKIKESPNDLVNLYKLKQLNEGL